MRKCWGFFNNGKYQAGCNGATIYVYDANNTELAKFKDIPYAYSGAFKPNTNIFVAKSTEGKLAVYDSANFTKIDSYFAENKKMVLDAIEVDSNAIYLLGFMRGADGVMDYGFVSQFADGAILAPREIKSTAFAIAALPQKWAKTDYEYLSKYKSWERHGFTEKSSWWIETYQPEKPSVTIKQIYQANA